MTRLIAWMLGVWVLFGAGLAHAEGDVYEDVGIFRDLGYPAAMLTADEPLFEAWYELPSDWEMQRGSSVEVIYSVPKLAQATNKTAGALVVTVNGKERHREALPSEDARFRRLMVEIPPESPTPQGLHIQVAFVAHEEDCEPDERTVVLHEDSSIRVKYSMRPPAHNLGEFPYPLITQRARDLRRVAMRMAVADEHRRALLELAGALGKHAGTNPVRIEPLDPDAPLPKGHLVDIDLTSADPNPSLSVRAHPENDAWSVFTVAADSADAAALVARWIFSRSQLGVGTQRRFASEPPPESNSPWLATTVHFSDLGLQDVLFPLVKGVPKTFYFDRPPAILIDEDSTLTLAYSVPTGVAEGSVLVVSLGDEVLGRVRLEPGVHETVFELPGGRAGNRDGANRPLRHFVLKFESEGGGGSNDDEECTERETDFITIKPRSRWHLAPIEPTVLDLESFPAPLNGSGLKHPTNVVLADDRPHGALGFAASVAMRIGTDSLTAPRFELSSASDPAPTEGHLMMFGVVEDGVAWSQVAARLDDTLEVPTPTDSFEPVGAIWLRRFSKERAAGLVVLTDDWDAAHRALVSVFGTPGFSLAFDAKGRLEAASASGSTPELDRMIARTQAAWRSVPLPVFFGGVLSLVLAGIWYIRRRSRSLPQPETDGEAA